MDEGELVGILQAGEKDQNKKEDASQDTGHRTLGEAVDWYVQNRKTHTEEFKALLRYYERTKLLRAYEEAKAKREAKEKEHREIASKHLHRKGL